MKTVTTFALAVVLPTITNAAEGISFQNTNFNSAEREDTAVAVRSSGYACAEVKRVEKVYEHGRELPIFRVWCVDSGVFQATVMRGKVFVKPWTGNLIGR